MENTIEIRPGRTINVNHYKNPASEATIFLIHGLGGRSQQWHEQIEPLLEKNSLVVPDLLGHGKSQKPYSFFHNLYAFKEFNQDLENLFQRFASKRNIFIGHSYGGALTAWLAANYPTQVEKLILLSPMPCQPQKAPLIHLLPAFVLEWLRPTLEKQFLDLAFADSTDPAIILEEASASRTNPMYMIQSMVLGLKKIPELNLSNLNIPTMIMLGQHDRLIPPIQSEQFYQGLPDHRIEMILNAAHMEMIEQPKQCNQLMLKFLTQ